MTPNASLELPHTAGESFDTLRAFGQRMADEVERFTATLQPLTDSVERFTASVAALEVERPASSPPAAGLALAPPWLTIRTGVTRFFACSPPRNPALAVIPGSPPESRPGPDVAAARSL